MEANVRRGILIVLGIVVGAVVVAGIALAALAHSYDASMEKVYDIPLATVSRSTEPLMLARGKHLVESVAGCGARECHGADLAGGAPLHMGPLATLSGPNITSAGLGSSYTEAEVARLIRHGVKKDGRSVTFMPVQGFDWLRDDDLVALTSYLGTVPAVARTSGPETVNVFGKVLDRLDKVVLDVARHVQETKQDIAPAPTPTAQYGAYLAKLCTDCHGATLSGGAFPGSGPDGPVASNLTPDASGLKGWSYDDFAKVLRTGVRKSGAMLSPVMPIVVLGKLDDTEMRALYSYLQQLPPRPFGGR